MLYAHTWPKNYKKREEIRDLSMNYVITKVKCPPQCPGRFLGLIGQGPSVSKCDYTKYDI